jgi:hypothetical protein
MPPRQFLDCFCGLCPALSSKAAGCMYYGEALPISRTSAHLFSFEALLGFKPIPLWKMEAPTSEPVVIHPGRSRRLATGISTGPGPTSSGTDINIGGAQYFLGAGGKLPKGGHDVHAELVPIEKKDHLGLLSTTYAIQKSCRKTGLQPNNEKGLFPLLMTS